MLSADILARMDEDFKTSIAKILVFESVGVKGLKRVEPVISQWVDQKGYGVITFLVPKAGKNKKANKMAGRLLDLLEEIVEADGKAFLETRRERPYKNEVGVLHFKPARLMKTFQSLSDEFKAASKPELERAQACLDRMGGYEVSDYVPRNNLH